MKPSPYLCVIPVFIVLLLGSFPSLSAGAQTGLIITHGPRDSRSIALTFDACPTALADEYDKGVIETLVREKAPATLFLSGRWVEKNAATAKFLADQPQFEIAAHSYYHPHLLDKPDDRVVREMKRTQTIIRKITGRTPRYFRPPFGEVDERVAKLALQAGLVTIQYDIASGDPDPGLSSRRIVRALLRDAKGGSIIVLHMNRKGAHTAEFLPDVIEGLRKQGFTLVTVGDLLKK